MNKSFEYLFDAIKSLPGVGTKQAKAISNFLIHQDDKYIYDFIERIKEAKQNIKFCKQCNNLVSSGELCDICLNHDRNQKKLCIVASIDDLQKIEDTNEFVGLYFVLHEEVNVKTKTNISKEIIQQLMKYLQDKKFNEIILALNWTVNGEATAIFIKKIINSILSNANIFRLAIGLPINSALDYADNDTLKHALTNKTKY